MKALKNTKLLPYNYPFKIYSIQKNNDLRTHLVCPECQERIKYQKVCPTHGPVTPIKRTNEGVILSEKELKEIKGYMKDFEVVGQVHIQSIPPYQLSKAYLVHTDFLPFLQLLLKLRRENRALLVKGTIKSGIKHFLLYPKNQYVFLQEIVENDVIQLTPCLPAESKKSKDSPPLPEPILIREVRAYNPKKKLQEKFQSI